MNSFSLRSFVNYFLVIYSFILVISCVANQDREKSKLVPIMEGFAKTHVNAVIFRRNSISSYNDHQYVSFYDDSANVVLAKRKLRFDEWEIHKTKFKGNVSSMNNIPLKINGSKNVLFMS